MRSLRGQLLASHLLLLGLMLLLLGGGVARFFHLGGSVDRVLDANVKSVLLMQRVKDSLAALDRSGGRDGAAAQQVAAAIEQERGNITEPGEREMAERLRDDFARYRRRPGGDSGPLTETAQAILELNLAAMRAADTRAKAEARQSALLGLAATALAAAIAIGLALRTVRGALLPLVSLTRQAESIGAGSLNQRIEVARDDEIGRLAGAFNAMSEKLAQARAALEARLVRAERTSDAALESLYDPVIVTDADGRTVHLNRAAAELLGPRLGEAVGEPRIAQAVATALRERRAVAAEDASALAALKGRIYRLRVSPMAADGQAFGAVAVLEDVTHLQEVDRLKTEFIGVASHELRTPVTSLLLSVQLLQEGALGPLPPAVAEVVAVQREDLLRLERLLGDLLDLSKLESGAAEPRVEPIPADALIDAACDGVRAEASSRGIALEVGPPCPTPVRADRGQIGRVLTNLLGNALRHTPEGGAITVSAEADGAGAVAFTVADTGAGIPAEYLEAVFERFTQVPGATRGGAGLGLALARATVAAHGGAIQARSDGPGKGSAFTFTLPTATGDE